MNGIVLPCMTRISLGFNEVNLCNIFFVIKLNYDFNFKPTQFNCDFDKITIIFYLLYTSALH